MEQEIVPRNDSEDDILLCEVDRLGGSPPVTPGHPGAQDALF